MEHYQNIDLENLPNEVWKSVVGYENIYQVSNMGRVKSLQRYVPFRNGNLRLTNVRILRQSINKHRGYPLVILQKNNDESTREVHRLVGQHFVDNPEGKPSVNHKDGVKYNNVVENLEWATWSEQTLHAIHVLKRSVGGKRVAKMNDDMEIIEVMDSLSDVNRKYGYNIGNLSARCRGVHNKRVGGFHWKYV